MKRLMMCVLVGGLMTAMLPGGATAGGPPKDVELVSYMTFNLPDYFPNHGDFQASGPAVDDGIMCASGDVPDRAISFAGFMSASRKLQVTAVKEFTCHDGSGTFLVKLQIHGLADGSESFRWVVPGGTQDYASLHGRGDGLTVDPGPTGNTNVYQGFVIN